MRICLSVALVVAVAGTLYAQPSTVTTYAGAIVPPAGMPAGLWAIGSPGFVTPDGAGGFYLSSDQNAIYRVLADGTIRLIAGNTYGIDRKSVV